MLRTGILWLFFFVVALLPSSCYVSKSIVESEKVYLNDSKEVIASYQKSYPSLSTYVLETQINRSKLSKDIIKQSRKVKLDRKIGVEMLKDEINLGIRPFELLIGSDKNFLSELLPFDKGSKSSMDLYYKLINYWLISHYFSHHAGEPILKGDTDNEYLNYEVGIEITNIGFLVSNNYTKKFDNFKKLIESMNSLACQKLGIEKASPENLLYHESKYRDLIHYLFYKSSWTIMAIDRIYDEQNVKK